MRSSWCCTGFQNVQCLFSEVHGKVSGEPDGSHVQEGQQGGRCQDLLRQPRGVSRHSRKEAGSVTQRAVSPRQRTVHTEVPKSDYPHARLHSGNVSFERPTSVGEDLSLR